MIIAKVIGNVWATKKDERLNGHKLLVLSTQSSGREETLVAVDTIGAGLGDDVLVVKGSVAKNIANDQKSPIDAAVVGIIDSVEVDEKILK